MLLCGRYKSVVINRETAVVRMADDVDSRILYGIQVGVGVLEHGAALDTGSVKAGDGVVQGFQKVLLHIDGSFIVYNI